MSNKLAYMLPNNDEFTTDIDVALDEWAEGYYNIQTQFREKYAWMHTHLQNELNDIGDGTNVLL